MAEEDFQIVIGDPLERLSTLPQGAVDVVMTAPPADAELKAVLNACRPALTRDCLLWFKLDDPEQAKVLESEWILLDSRPNKGLYLFTNSEWIEWTSKVLVDLPEPVSGSLEPFPMTWAEALLRTSSKKGQTILDPLARTGALGAMAVYLGRKAIQVVPSEELAAKAKVRAEKALEMREASVPKAEPPDEAVQQRLPTEDKRWRVIKGDCLDVLKQIPDESIDAVVTDPPYHLTQVSRYGSPRVQGTGPFGRHTLGQKGFMGKTWDGGDIAFQPELWIEVMRVLKPGGHVLTFGGTRTYHRMACAVEDVGFEIRDSISSYQGSSVLDWVYAAGFPKSMDVSKAIDKAERGVPQGGEDPTSPNHGKYKTQLSEGKRDSFDNGQGYGAGPGQYMREPGVSAARELVPDALPWNGYGTALRPSHEPILVARRPLSEPTVAAQVLKTGTGAINIDGCRTETEPRDPGNVNHTEISGKYGTFGVDARTDRQIHYRENKPTGRWPANVVYVHSSECVRVGTERVNCWGPKPDQVGLGREGNYTNGIYGAKASKVTSAYVDDDGKEAVETWECVEDCPIRLLNEQGGIRKSGTGAVKRASAAGFQGNAYGKESRPEGTEIPTYGDSGPVSRYFPTFAWNEEDAVPFLYVAKAPRSERDAGLDDRDVNKDSVWRGLKSRQCNVCGSRALKAGTTDLVCGHTDFSWVEKLDDMHKGSPRNSHPTVKPIALMRWLVRLVTQPGGVVLDPFSGSGTTGAACLYEGFRFIGIEQDPSYVEIARARIAYAEQKAQDEPEQRKRGKRPRAPVRAKDSLPPDEGNAEEQPELPLFSTEPTGTPRQS